MLPTNILGLFGDEICLVYLKLVESKSINPSLGG